MSKRDDGGPVFPTYQGHAACLPEEGCRMSVGMTLRDYFAAKALSAMTAHSLSEEDGLWDTDAIAQDCYRLADAMLAERSRPPDGERKP